MNQKNTAINPSIGKKINNEQIEQIVKAIIAGKYSWACVLILRVAGYNPIDYIPYRTYIRLLKNNCLIEASKPNQTESFASNSIDILPNYQNQECHEKPTQQSNVGTKHNNLTRCFASFNMTV